MYVSLIERTSETSDTDSSKLDDEGAKTEERIRGGEMRSMSKTPSRRYERQKKIRICASNVFGPLTDRHRSARESSRLHVRMLSCSDNRRPRANRVVSSCEISFRARRKLVPSYAEQYCVAVSVLGVCFRGEWTHGRSRTWKLEDVAEPKVVEHFIELTPPASILRAAMGTVRKDRIPPHFRGRFTFCWGVGLLLRPVTPRI